MDAYITDRLKRQMSNDRDLGHIWATKEISRQSSQDLPTAIVSKTNWHI